MSQETSLETSLPLQVEEEIGTENEGIDKYKWKRSVNLRHI